MLESADIQNLYESHAKRLIQFLMANGLDYSLACDLSQQAFIRLWKHRQDIEDAHAASGFLFTVVKNLKVDYHRKNNRMSFREDMSQEDVGTVEHPQSDGRDILALRQALQQAFAQLPDSLREVFILFQVSGYSVKEIAQRLDISESLVKVRVHRAKAKLQDILSDLTDLESYLS